MPVASACLVYKSIIDYEYYSKLRKPINENWLNMTMKIVAVQMIYSGQQAVLLLVCVDIMFTIQLG